MEYDLSEFPPCHRFNKTAASAWVNKYLTAKRRDEGLGGKPGRRQVEDFLAENRLWIPSDERTPEEAKEAEDCQKQRKVAPAEKARREDVRAENIVKGLPPVDEEELAIMKLRNRRIKRGVYADLDLCRARIAEMEALGLGKEAGKLRECESRLERCGENLNRCTMSCQGSKDPKAAIALEKMGQFAKDLMKALRASDVERADALEEKFKKDLGTLPKEISLLLGGKPKRPEPSGGVEESKRPPGDEHGDDPKFAKYTRMKNVGVPEGGIRLRMTMDGLSPDEIAKFFGEDVKPKGKVLPIPTELKRYEKFHKMFGDDRLIHRMMSEGMTREKAERNIAILKKEPVLPEGAKKAVEKPKSDPHERRVREWMEGLGGGWKEAGDAGDLPFFEEDEVKKGKVLAGAGALKLKEAKGVSFLDSKLEQTMAILAKGLKCKGRACSMETWVRELDAMKVWNLDGESVVILFGGLPKEISSEFKKAHATPIPSEGVMGFREGSRLVYLLAHVPLLQAKLRAAVLLSESAMNISVLRQRAETILDFVASFHSQKRQIRELMAVFKTFVRREIQRARARNLGREIVMWTKPPFEVLTKELYKKKFRHKSIPTYLTYLTYILKHSAPSTLHICDALRNIKTIERYLPPSEFLKALKVMNVGLRGIRDLFSSIEDEATVAQLSERLERTKDALEKTQAIVERALKEFHEVYTWFVGKKPGDDDFVSFFSELITLCSRLRVAEKKIVDLPPPASLKGVDSTPSPKPPSVPPLRPPVRPSMGGMAAVFAQIKKP